MAQLPSTSVTRRRFIYLGAAVAGGTGLVATDSRSVFSPVSADAEALRTAVPGPQLVSQVQGLTPDCRLLTDANISAGANVLSSATAVFTTADVGKLVGILGAGAPNIPFTGTITGFTDSHHVTLGTSASNTVTNGFAAYGTDNLAALAAAVAALGTNGGTLSLPPGSFATSNTWVIPSNVSVEGAGRNQTALYLIASIKNTGGPFAVIEFATAAGGGPSAGLVDRVSCKALRVGIIPAEARSQNGNGIAMIATNFLIDDCEVYVPGSAYSTMASGILVYNNNNSGAPAGPGTIRNCSTSNTIAGGIFTLCCTGVRIQGNYIFNSGDDGIAGTGGNGGTTQQSETAIVGNTIRNAGGAGIDLVGGIRYSVTGNTVTNTFGSGIQAISYGGYLGVTEVTITGNVINGAGLMSQPTYNVQTGASGVPVGSPNGIYIWVGSNSLAVNEVVISGNSVASSRCCHIALAGGPSAINIVAVSITGNSTFGDPNETLGAGQSVPPGLTDVAHCPGIYLHYADAVSIVGNKIESPNREGIYYDSSCGYDWLPIIGNAIHNAGANTSASSVAAIKLGQGKATIVGNFINNFSGHVSVSVDLGGTASVCGGNQLAGIATANSSSGVGWAMTVGTVS